MASADEYLRDRVERRARKSVQYGRVPEERQSRQPAAAGGIRARENTRFLDNTGQEVAGLSTIVGTMTTGPA